jgi:alpha-maltose-1-phosphate synthase
MRIAFLTLGAQSGVTASVIRGFQSLGHQVDEVDATDALMVRKPGSRLPRLTPRVLFHLAASAYRFGTQYRNYRCFTPFAFDVHSRRAGTLLSRLPEPPDVVLQSGAVFAPGAPPRYPYVLLCDNTCSMAERQPAASDAEIGVHVTYCEAWLRREHATYSGASAVAVFSEVVRASLVDDYGISPERVTVVRAGANIVSTGERHHDGRSLLFIGKGNFGHKGGRVLLRAFRRLREKYRDLRLTLIGPTEPLDLPDGVTNLGVQPLDRVADSLRQATMFVLPTLREPFGIAFLDAMASAVPCVGTHLGAIPEILGGVAGVTVAPGDDEALAAAVSSLLADPARATAMGLAGRRRVLENGYLWPAVTRRLEAVVASARSTAAASAAQLRLSAA